MTKLHMDTLLNSKILVSMCNLVKIEVSFEYGFKQLHIYDPQGFFQIKG